MALKKSYLSKREIVDKKSVKSYNADMVTVISEQAINSQMLQYLASCTTKQTVYFLSKQDLKTRSVLYHMVDANSADNDIPDAFKLEKTLKEIRNANSTLFKEFEKLDLFSLPDTATSDDTDALAIAKKYRLLFAVEIEDGIPAEIMAFMAKNKGKVNLNRDLKIITVDRQKQALSFKQFFKKFKILQILSEDNEFLLSVLEQKCTPSIGNLSAGLWSNTCSIGVDLEKINSSQIKDPEVKQQIQKMAYTHNIDTVFDISRLFMDLRTLKTISSEKITGLDIEVESQINTFVTAFFNRLQDAGQTVMGHMVLPTPNMKVNYLFKPTRRNFAVGTDCLYYLMNLEDARAPLIPDMGNKRDFEWAPLLDGTTVADGAMIISATKFLPFLRDIMHNVIEPFRTFSYPYFDKDGTTLYIHKGTKTNKSGFVVDENEPWKANWEFKVKNEQKREGKIIPHGWITSSYKASCSADLGTVTYKGIVYPSYNFTLKAGSWMNVHVNGESNKGDVYDGEIEFLLGIKVDHDGNFQLLPVINVKKNNCIRIDVGGWTKFSIGDADEKINRTASGISERVKRMAGLSMDTFMNQVNTFTGWFLPGCRTFTYKNEGISDYGDLYTYVNYVQEVEGIV